MVVRVLRGVAHHQHAAGLQQHTHRAVRRRLGADQHLARVPQRQDGDRLARRQVGDAVVVRRHAVAAVAVQVEPGVRVGRRRHAAYRRRHRIQQRRPRRVIQQQARHQPRHRHRALVHPALLAVPVDGLAQLVEPGAMQRGRHHLRPVHDAALGVVQQRHGLVTQHR